MKKTVKKILCIVLSVIMVVLSMPFSTFYGIRTVAANTEPSNYVVLVIDAGGTASFTSNNTPLYTANSAISYVRQAAIKFLECMYNNEESTKIAIVKYNSSATVVSDFSDNFEVLKTKINSISSSSTRNMNSGLEKAEYLLSQIPENEGVNKNVVLFTTGMTNSGEYNYTGQYNANTVGSSWYYSSTNVNLYAYANKAIEAAERIKEAAKMYTIGLFQIFDDMPNKGKDIVEFFKLTAKDTATASSYYYPVENPDNLKYIFDEVANDILGAVKGTLVNDGIHYDYTYSDNYFSQSAYNYNHKLALASMCLATSVMTHPGAGKDEIYGTLAGEDEKESDDYKKNYKRLEELNAASEFFETIGANHYEFYGYNSKPQTDSIACVIGNKNTKINGQDETIIIIGIRGAGYESEWSGNFNVGTSTTHKGFNIAKDKVLLYLSNYLKEFSSSFNSNIKFWITGYSRAAATANLVASVIDNYGWDGNVEFTAIGRLNYNVDDVYAYTFETPRNTRNEDATSEKYENIFNIVNPVDFVTKVAPSAWDYVRYGVDCYLPTPETYGSDIYNSLKNRMVKKYKEISKSTYSDEFEFNNLGILGIVSGGTLYDTIGKLSLSRFLDDFMDKMAKHILKDVDTYVDKYQSAIRKLMPLIMVNVGIEGVEFEKGELGDELLQLIKNNLKSVVKKPGDISHILKTTIAIFLEDNFQNINLTYSEIYDALSIIDELLIVGLTNIDYVSTLIANGGEIASKHFPELCLAWMASVDGEFVYEENSFWTKLTTGEHTYRIIKFNCPIEIYLYDENDVLMATIRNNEVEFYNGCTLSIYIDSDGQKCFCLPNDINYRFEVLGTDEGTMTCSVVEYNFAAGINESGVNYYSIPIGVDTALTMTVSEKNNDDIYDDISLKNTKTNEKIMQSETLEATAFTVNTFTISEMSNVIGGGIYNKGEFSKLQAIPSSCSAFDGWYIDENTCISSDLVYRHMVMSDTTLEARFIDGLHTDENYDGKCDACGYDATKDCSCNCHKGGIAGFFFKIILFFQKIFKTNKTCSCGVNHY